MTPRPGDFFVTATDGWVGRAIRLITRSDVNHAGVWIGWGDVVEAQPHGARVTTADSYPAAKWSTLDLTDAQRSAIVSAAQHYVGTPYNFLDIAALFLVHALGWHIPGFVRRRLSSPRRMICSQLVDQCYQDAGVHLFTDGRIPGDVTPGDLERVLTPADLRRFCS